MAVPRRRAPTRPLAVWPGHGDVAILGEAMPLTCLIVDDSFEFFEAAAQLLAGDGLKVVGFAWRVV